jgi:hypothetical protein
MGMAINQPVIVTALYDIGRDNWEKFTQSYGGYIHWMERTLSLDSKMVIYTQARFKDEIEKYRRKYDVNLDKTILIIQELEELESYKLYNDKLTNLMSSDVFLKKAHFDVPEMTKPLYNVIMFNKVFWLKDTVDKRYFDNDMVLWLDAGGLRSEISTYVNRVWPNLDNVNELDNDKITFFSHNADFDVNDKQFHSLSQIRHIQGTAFLVPSHKIEYLTNEVIKTIDESIVGEYIGSDEKIFDIAYVRDKNSYHLIKCTWREYFDILKNPPVRLDKTKLKVIVARYNEDVEWVDKIKYDTIVFNKNENDVNLFENNLPNVGREGHTFFSYIVNNYEYLPEYVAFLQGKPNDHCANFIDDINTFSFNTEFKQLGPLFEEITTNEHINQQVIGYANKIGFEIKFPLYYVRGAQYIISRNLLHKKPKAYYEKILDTLSYDVYPWDGLNVEKTLFQIYGIYKPTINE